MPKRLLVYPFDSLPSNSGKNIYRPHLPIFIRCVKTGLYRGFIALADTGADACLIPGGAVAKILGDSVNSGISNPNGASGIGATKMPTWKHSFIITLLTPDRQNKAWESSPIDIDCTEESDRPLLLGTIGFLENFKATFDYQTKRLTLEFDVP